MRKVDAAIVGAGLSGSLLAVHLARLGYRVALVERRPDPRKVPLDSRRSITLAVPGPLIGELRALGVPPVATVPLSARVLHRRDGSLAREEYALGEADEPRLLTPRALPHAVSRAALNRALVEAAGHRPGVTLEFERPVEQIEPRSGWLWIPGRAAPRPLEAGLIVAADGASSRLRARLRAGGEVVVTDQPFSHEYKALSLAAGELEPGCFHLWPRQGHLLSALPDPDGNFAGTFFAPPAMFAELRRPEDARAFFAEEFPGLELPEFHRQWSEHPVSSLRTVRCAPWHRDRVVLVGDACHAMLPFTGQGFTAAVEDCRTLARRLEAGWPDLESALQQYAGERIAPVQAQQQFSLMVSRLVLGALPESGIAGRL